MMLGSLWQHAFHGVSLVHNHSRAAKHEQGLHAKPEFVCKIEEAAVAIPGRRVLIPLHHAALQARKARRVETVRSVQSDFARGLHYDMEYAKRRDDLFCPSRTDAVMPEEVGRGAYWKAWLPRAMLRTTFSFQGCRDAARSQK